MVFYFYGLKQYSDICKLMKQTKQTNTQKQFTNNIRSNTIKASKY